MIIAYSHLNRLRFIKKTVDKNLALINEGMDRFERSARDPDDYAAQANLQCTDPI